MNIETMRLLVAKGLSAEDILEVAEAMASAEVPAQRSAAAERQARYRARKAAGEAEDVTDSVTRDVTSDGNGVTDPALSLPPNEIKSNPPTHTHPEGNTRAQGPWDFHVSAWAKWREANPFPRPWWAKPGIWADLKANRKAKRLPNTVSAHTKLLRDLEAMSDDDWPPGRLLEDIVARGWAAAHDPRGQSRNDRKSPRNPEIRDPFARVVAERQADRAAGLR